jgi:thiol-disulfide isomerase/thioredoxin
MPCREELPSLDRLAQRYPGVRFLAVNVEDALMKPRIEAFVRQTGLAMPVAYDGGEASARYHASSIPHLVILDRTGKISQTFTGVYESSVIAQALDLASASAPN